MRVHIPRQIQRGTDLAVATEVRRRLEAMWRNLGWAEDEVAEMSSRVAIRVNRNRSGEVKTVDVWTTR